ncbi:DUF2264 domain-containing protein [Vibrio vulnificus]|nr:DUF2264 domain-containing protein [Vibrio vulnificus]
MYNCKKLKSFHRNKLRLFNHFSNENQLDKKFNSRRDFLELFSYLHQNRRERLKLRGTRLPNDSFVSKNGKDIDAIEGVTRYLPYWTAYALNMGSQERGFNLKEIFNIISEGTNKFGNNYWGDPDDYDQILCEASDVAISLWMLKEEINNYLTIDEKKRIVDWLSLVISKEYYNNNWILFKITVEIFLKSIHVDVSISYDKYLELKSWYADDGWFHDGPGGEIDYYSCWGFSYGLFWINEMDPKFDPDFIKSSILSLARSYLKLVDNRGIPPFFGRSISYRMSALTPLVCATNFEYDISELAHDVLCKTFTHFSQHGAFQNNSITSGYYETDLRFVDNYSGPNSSLWSLRGILICEYLYGKGIDIYSKEGKRLSDLLERDISTSLCNNLLTIKSDGKYSFLENKTLKYKGYSNSKIVAIKVKIKCVIDYLLYFRRDRQVKYRENFEIKFSSSNEFYLRERLKCK